MPILQIIENPEKKLWPGLLGRPIISSENLETECEENIGGRKDVGR